MSKHTVIFSHGFGVRRDSRGMFTEIAAALQAEGIESVLFDYNLYDDQADTLTITPLSKQAEILNRMILDARTASPAGIIDLIGHSQGTVAIGLARPEGVRKTLLLAPPATLNLEVMKEVFLSRPGAQTDFNGISYVPRRDGSTSLITPEYWEDLKQLNPIELFNNLPHDTEVSIINANQDEIILRADFSQLLPSIKVTGIDADHDFTGPARPQLIQAISSELVDA